MNRSCRTPEITLAASPPMEEALCRAQVKVGAAVPAEQGSRRNSSLSRLAAGLTGKRLDPVPDPCDADPVREP
jgi:hypothetical protein